MIHCALAVHVKQCVRPQAEQACKISSVLVSDVISHAHDQA